MICGQTEIPSDQLVPELAKLKAISPDTGKSKLEDQFEVSISFACLPTQILYELFYAIV